MPKSFFPIHFIGGSHDGANLKGHLAPQHIQVPVEGELLEIYEWQNEEPPFVYVQIGYAEDKTWK
jgi:hypothetical protein